MVTISLPAFRGKRGKLTLPAIERQENEKDQSGGSFLEYAKLEHSPLRKRVALSGYRADRL